MPPNVNILFFCCDGIKYIYKNKISFYHINRVNCTHSQSAPITLSHTYHDFCGQRMFTRPFAEYTFVQNDHFPITHWLRWKTMGVSYSLQELVVHIYHVASMRMDFKNSFSRYERMCAYIWITNALPCPLIFRTVGICWKSGRILLDKGLHMGMYINSDTLNM